MSFHQLLIFKNFLGTKILISVIANSFASFTVATIFDEFLY